MKILILKSKNNYRLSNEHTVYTGYTDYTVSMNTSFADRFISHMTDQKGFCKACEKGCTGSVRNTILISQKILLIP